MTQQLFNHGHGWENIDQINARKAREASDSSLTSEDTPKLTKKEIVAELKALGVEFKANAKTEVLLELLNQSKTAQETETSKSEQ